ncbi:nitrite reductase small subunit NirD [Nonomuraea sp. NPDC000554]|uniref:nitrite reductase small subunit NirD n=1 Tax=Nonomuraea sp. NPDC000554 TaxID=3154259 RepID=UPI00331BB56F
MSRWTPVCDYRALLSERGVCALVDGRQVAVFLTHEGTVHAIANLDPFSGAHVLSRGIVGSRNGEPTVASPMHKQVFSLLTGVCLDQPEVAVEVCPARVLGSRVEVAAARRLSAAG